MGADPRRDEHPPVAVNSRKVDPPPRLYRGQSLPDHSDDPAAGPAWARGNRNVFSARELQPGDGRSSGAVAVRSGPPRAGAVQGSGKSGTARPPHVATVLPD